MEKGNLVVATRGKEKNQFFVIMNVEDNFAYIVDGKRLKLTNPKKKSMKHIAIASKDKFSVELFKVNNECTFASFFVCDYFNNLMFSWIC